MVVFVVVVVVVGGGGGGGGDTSERTVGRSEGEISIEWRDLYRSGPAAE